MRWLLASTILAQSIFLSALGCAERHASVEAPASTAAPDAARSASDTPAASGPSAASSTATSSAPPPLASSAPATSPAVARATDAPSDAVGSTPATPTEKDSDPPLSAPDGRTLPQTEARPSVDSPAFKRRIERLAQCILRDEPSSCRASFFPLLAYREVKAIEKPERDYQYRLIRHFERDIHEYNKLLGDGAKFEGIDVPENAVRWMKPGSEGNKVGYFRVLRSRLRFTKSNGKAQALELTSMISWRGEWYVVHLHGFQ